MKKRHILFKTAWLFGLSNEVLLFLMKAFLLSPVHTELLSQTVLKVRVPFGYTLTSPELRERDKAQKQWGPRKGQKARGC